ncbi:MAG TPA: hypothetical protein VMA77_33830 [Solirubrobacteraceae bacterium]|nr:hypothetical protein [Solirubrobacteraceae bacterium]
MDDDLLDLPVEHVGARPGCARLRQLDEPLRAPAISVKIAEHQQFHI